MAKMEVDSLVWAQLRYCPYWPAKVVNTPPELGRKPANKICVLFMGTKQFGFVDRERVQSYIENRQKFANKGRGIAFAEAVKQMDEFVSDPIKFRTYAYAKPIRGKIKIKNESDVRQNLGIKIEKKHAVKIERQSINKITFAAPSSEANDREKKALLDAFGSLKTENQQLTFDLKKKGDEYSAINSEKKNLVRKISSMTEEINALESNLSQAKDDLLKIDAKYKQQISDLSQENRLLSARLKQCETGMARNDDDDEVFEVGKILADKQKRNVRYFLVRWKGYSEKDDTWEREDNLMCPEVLKEYLDSKK